MKIVYQFFNDWSDVQRLVLKKFGVELEEGFGNIQVVDNSENKKLLETIRSWKLDEFYGTEFEKKDYEKSNLFLFEGVWENGYPQPETIDGYMNLTYDLKNYCTECGVGAIQKAPFRIKKEPKWGNKMIFELGWVFDELFVKKDIYESVFKKKYKLDCKDVLLYKKDTVVNDTVQLIIPKIDIPLVMGDTPFEVCTKCKRKKYNPQIKGYLPGFAKHVPELNIFKCSEYFGSGGGANNRVFVTKDFWEELKRLQLKPTVWPVTPDYK